MTLGPGLTLSIGSARPTGGAAAPELDNFTDGMAQDPPYVEFISTDAGTATWDFHSSDTPPTPGQGDHATGTFAVVAGVNNASIDLSALAPGTTGYIHLSVDGSNVLTSQEITISSAEVVEDELGLAETWTLTGMTGSGDTLTAVTASGNTTTRARASVSVTAPGSYTLKLDKVVTTGMNPSNDNWVAVFIYGLSTPSSPIRTQFDLGTPTGTVAYTEALAARITKNPDNTFNCEIDIDLTGPDGSGVIDFGPNDTASPTVSGRITDPSGQTLRIQNPRVVVRS
jgi:hypothetical protein